MYVTPKNMSVSKKLICQLQTLGLIVISSAGLTRSAVVNDNKYKSLIR